MTQKIDTFLVGLNFDAKELEQLNHRAILYAGIIFMAACSTFFTTMAIAGIL